MSEAELLAAYDAQLRGEAPDPLPAGVGVARDGPLAAADRASVAGASSSIATSAVSTAPPSTR